MLAYQKIIQRKAILFSLGLLLLGALALFFIVYNKTHPPKPDNHSATPATTNLPDKNYRILHVMSYHSPWEWTDTLFSGFQSALSI